MKLGGALLKTNQSLLRLLQLLGAILILGIYSYFLAVQSKHGLFKPAWVKAVEAIAGAAILWTFFALLLTCFVGGATGFGIPALILDLLFFGAFIAVTIMTRSGRRSCSGDVTTPLGSGNTRTGRVLTRPTTNFRPNLVRTCRLQKAVFAVAIILFILFLLSAVVQILLVRHHRKEKRYGPSPANNYTEGSAKKRGLFGRKNKNTTRDAEIATAGTTTTAPAATATHGALHAEKPHHDMRPSHETAYTGSTAAPDAGYNAGVTSVHDHRPIAPTNNYAAPTYQTPYQQNQAGTVYPDTTTRY